MGVDYNLIGKFKTLDDFNREAEEFDARKKQALLEQQKTELEAQKLRKDIETGVTGADPAAIKEWGYYSKLPPEQQQRYLQMKRADQIMNLGGNIAVRNPQGGIAEAYQVTPKPEQMPEFQGAQAGAISDAKNASDLSYKPRIEKANKIAGEAGAREADLNERVADLPQLEDTVAKLSDLGKKATYTAGGQILDIGRKQMGLTPREGAIARTEYMSLVDNQILPLLRQTFGAQFTVREGDTLRATLGDPDKTPQEKDAVLRSFIDQKKQVINSRQRQLGMPETDYASPGIQLDGVAGSPNVASASLDVATKAMPRKGDIVDWGDQRLMFNGGDVNNKSNWKRVQ
jgi:hypothetical protein